MQNIIKRNKKLTYSLIIILALLLSEALLFADAFLISGHAMINIKHKTDISNITTEFLLMDNELEQLKLEIEPVIQNSNNDFDKALLICAWINDQVTKESGDISIDNRTPMQILSAMRKNKTGASCGFRSLLYVAALQSVGIDARQTSHIKTDNISTHAGVEIKINNNWIVIDPTFNCYYLIDGKLASAIDLYNYYHTKNGNIEICKGYDSINPVPAYISIDNMIEYYNGILIYEKRHYYWWQALPIIQIFNGIS